MIVSAQGGISVDKVVREGTEEAACEPRTNEPSRQRVEQRQQSGTKQAWYMVDQEGSQRREESVP